jgi:hypothetical protein
MSRKLIFTIIVFSFAALELLAVRQEQINTVYEMTKLHDEIDAKISTIDALRIKIETASSPAILNNAMTTADELDGSE